MERKFQYAAFERKNSIRLLHVTPDSPHNFRIRHHSLDEPPPYAALSYTWGENIFDHIISIDDASFLVTKNLHNGLSAIHSGILKSGLPLWIDAICINQADITERSSQVDLMDRIYRSAQKVVVWLGEASGDSDLAMEKMGAWSDMLDDKNDAGRLDYKARYYGSPGSGEHKAWMAILELWERPWWRRAWVVQEATALNQRQTELSCGSKVVDMRALRLILDIRYGLAQLPDHYLMATFEQGFAEHLDNFKSRMEYGPQSLLYVLQHMRTYDCKDARDKVYAARGMAADVGPNDLIPDYTKSVEQVYTDTVRFFLRISKPSRCLDFLGYVVTPTDDWHRLSVEHKLKSTWVPDWRGPKADIVSFTKTLAGHASQPQLPAYSATRDSTARLEIHELKLHIHGINVDQITSVTEICTEGRPLVTDMERSWRPEKDGPYVAGGTLIEAYNHTLVADKLRKHDMNDWQSPWLRGGAMDWSLFDADASTLSTDHLNRKTHMLNDLKCTTFGRRMFNTVEGYIGIGPAAMRANDRICGLLGGQVLYVLREDMSSYQFVGECYVHGLMDGEIMHNGDEVKKHKHEIFIIS